MDTSFSILPAIRNGICSAETEIALVQNDCFNSIILYPSYVYYSIYQLIRDTCTENVYQTWRSNMAETIGKPQGFQIRPPDESKRRRRRKHDRNVGSRKVIIF